MTLVGYAWIVLYLEAWKELNHEFIKQFLYTSLANYIFLCIGSEWAIGQSISVSRLS